MENFKKNIKKVEKVISEDCPAEKKEIIQKYWDYDANYQFSKLPSQIARQYRINQTKLNATVSEFSYIIFSLNCQNCKTVERNHFTSQAPFRHIITELKKLGNDYKCKQCQANEDEKTGKKKQLSPRQKECRDNKVLVDKVKMIKIAIANKSWNTLNEFESLVLKKAIVFNNLVELKEYYYGMGDQYYKRLFSALRILDHENLLHLEYESSDKSRIKRYYLLGLLSKEFLLDYDAKHMNKNNPKEEASNPSHKLELTIPTSKEQDTKCPSFDTTFSVTENVVFKPREEYACNLYNEANGSISIKISQVKKVKEMPTQIRLDALPTELRKQVEDYLRNNDKNV